MAELIPADGDPRLLDRLLALLPGVVEPSAVADAVAYLASPSASMITGHALVVDGGRSA